MVRSSLWIKLQNFSKNKKELESYLSLIGDFLKRKLKFEIHPDKVFIKTVFSGVDFLGWTHFPKYRVLRTKTKKRMFRNMKNSHSSRVISSYLGLLNHGNAHNLQKKVKNMVRLG